MNSTDQLHLEKAYLQIQENYQAFGTPLRPNYSFSQIKEDSWRGDSRFQGVDIRFPDKENWEADLKFDGKNIELLGKGKEVYVDGNLLNFEERLNLRNYIIKHYASSKDQSDKFTGPPAFTSKGEPI